MLHVASRVPVPFMRRGGGLSGIVDEVRARLAPSSATTTALPDPPFELMHAIGATDAASFHAVGEEFVGYFERFGLLGPNHHVLDIGCGSGRLAIPLTRKLSRRGRYEGFDVEPPGVEWARREITSRFPNFRFHVADVRNDRYNPAGRTAARDYRFPYKSESFDLEFLTSVFTHLLPDDLVNYVAEIRRTLKPGGHVFMTFFLVNPQSLKAIRRHLPEYPTFEHDHGIHRIENPSVPEEAVAYDERFLLRLLERVGLHVVGVHPGAWSGRPDFLTFQDVVIARG